MAHLPLRKALAPHHVSIGWKFKTFGDGLKPFFLIKSFFHILIQFQRLNQVILVLRSADHYTSVYHTWKEMFISFLTTETVDNLTHVQGYHKNIQTSKAFPAGIKIGFSDPRIFCVALNPGPPLHLQCCSDAQQQPAYAQRCIPVVIEGFKSRTLRKLAGSWPFLKPCPHHHTTTPLVWAQARSCRMVSGAILESETLGNFRYRCSTRMMQPRQKCSFRMYQYLRSLYVNESKKGGIISYNSDQLCKGHPVTVYIQNIPVNP